MNLNLDNLSTQACEAIQLPTNAELVSDKAKYTTDYLRSLYPENERIYVLDFPVLFKEGEATPMFGPNGEMLGLIDTSAKPVIINIDHHSIHAQFDKQNISTTHQCLVANHVLKLLPCPTDKIIVNHVDTDSVLSVLAFTNPNLHSRLKVLLAHTAIAADHTGEFSPLITLIDSLYHERDLILSLEVVKNFLISPNINQFEEYIVGNYEDEILKRNKTVEIVKEGKFEDFGNGVMLIRLNGIKSMQSLPFPAEFEKAGINAKVIIIANPFKGKFKLNVRQGRGMPENITIQHVAEALKLERYGYGGRAKAGGNDRNIDEAAFITPEDFAQLISDYLSIILS